MPIVQVWSAPRCQDDAEELGTLPRWTSSRVVEASAGVQGPSFTVPQAVAQEAGLRAGAWLWISHERRGTFECPVISVVRTDGRNRDSVRVQGGTMRQGIALRGAVRVINPYDAPTITFTPPALTPTQILTNYVLTNLAEDNLAWLSLGVVDYDGTIQLPSFTDWTRGQVLDALEAATGFRVKFTRLSGNAGYQIDLRDPKALEVTEVVLAPGALVNDIEATEDLVSGATRVEPRTSAGAPMRDTQWTVSAITGSAPDVWVALKDPAGGPAVIREDGQLDGWYLVPGDGAPLLIADSRASDSAVKVATKSGLTVGHLASIWETEEGRLPDGVRSPTGLAKRGRVVQPISVAVPSARSNRLVDPALRDGLAAWEVFGAAYGGAEVYSRTDPRTVPLTIDGAVLSGATSIDVDGGTKNAILRFGEPILVAGTDAEVASTVTTDAAGKATVPLVGTLPATIPGDTALAWTRDGVAVATATTDGTQSFGAGSLLLKGLRATPQLAAGDTLVFTGSATLTLDDSLVNYSDQTIANGTAVSVVERVLVPPGFLGLPPSSPPQVITLTWTTTTVGSAGPGVIVVLDTSTRPADGGGEVVSVAASLPISFSTVTATLSGAQPAWSNTLTATAVASAAVTLQAGTLLGWSRSGSAVGGTVRVASAVSSSVNIPLELLNSYTQVRDGDLLSLPAQTLYVGAFTQLDTNGAGAVPLRVATTAAIPDNTVARLQRPIDLAPDAFGGPHVIRLRGAWASAPVGADYRSTSKFALYSPPMRVQSPNPTAANGEYVAIVELGLTRWAAESGQAQRGWWALWDADTGGLLTTGGFSNVTPSYTPLFNVSTHTTPGTNFVNLGTGPRRLRLSLHPGGGEVGDGPGGFSLLRYVALTITTSASADINAGVARVDGAFNNQMWHRAQDLLESKRELERIRVVLSGATIPDADPARQLAEGGLARVRSEHLNLDRVLRVERLEYTLDADTDIACDLAARSPRYSER